MSNSRRDGQGDEGGLGERLLAQSPTKLKRGSLVIYTPEQQAMSNDDVPVGSLGIFLRYREGWQKHLPGMEPIEVLFPVGVFTVYKDEVGLINEPRSRRHRVSDTRGEALGREDQ